MLSRAVLKQDNMLCTSRAHKHGCWPSSKGTQLSPRAAARLAMAGSRGPSICCVKVAAIHSLSSQPAAGPRAGLDAPLLACAHLLSFLAGKHKLLTGLRALAEGSHDADTAYEIPIRLSVSLRKLHLCRLAAAADWPSTPALVNASPCTLPAT